MKLISMKSILLMVVLLAMLSACKPKEQEVLKETPTEKPVATQEATPEPAKEAPIVAAVPDKPTVEQAVRPGKDIALEVNDKKLSRAQLDRMIDQRYQAIKANVPKGQEQEARAALRKEIINDFILRTILAQEADRLKIQVSKKESEEAFRRFEKSLPQGVTLKEVLKMNRITREKIQEDLDLGIKVGKILEHRSGGAKPTDKEVADFYEKNIELFKVPESVKARHILIASAPTDDDKAKQEKRERTEFLRKQLLAGADFAQLAATNSDCPSKNQGGDLGTFGRGQMVKAFEEAAFSQKINDIGQVVETDFGYHIIQVLEKNPAKTNPLDEETGKRISAHLKQERQRADFTAMIEQLRGKAKIVLH